MYCRLCQKHTIDCGHYAPYRVYAEPYKAGFRLYHYSGGLRSGGNRKLYCKTIFKDKETAILESWRMKNNISEGEIGG